MAKERRHTREQVIGEFREPEVELARGTPIAQACEDLAGAGPTDHRRRKEYGGMKLDRAIRREEPEEEEARQGPPADAESDMAILGEAASGGYQSRCTIA